MTKKQLAEIIARIHTCGDNAERRGDLHALGAYRNAEGIIRMVLGLDPS